MGDEGGVKRSPRRVTFTTESVSAGGAPHRADENCNWNMVPRSFRQAKGGAPPAPPRTLSRARLDSKATVGRRS